MEELYERLQIVESTLKTFQELIGIEKPIAIERDAAIHRFKTGFEVCWKAAKQYLYDVEGMDIDSPKSVIRSCREVGIFSENEIILGLQMVDHRNLTVYTYNEELAIEIYTHLPGYYQLLCDWMDRLSRKSV